MRPYACTRPRPCSINQSDRIIRSNHQINCSTDRVCTTPCRIGDLDFRVGDWLAINLWGIHHYEPYWPEPHKFMPERFVYAYSKRGH